MRLFRTLLLLFFAGLCAEADGQTVLTRRGKPVARIVVAAENSTDRTAALLLQRFVHEASGAELPIVQGVKIRKGDILLGASDTLGLSDDGFRLRTGSDGTLRISSGGGNGSIYGVVSLLERYLGMDYFAARVYTLDRRPDIILPRLDTADNPAFRYRQSQAYGMAQDSVYRFFLRLREPSDIFAGNLWVHTFDRLLPAERYGAEHPEYYSFIHGERRPGRASQWCLSNPALFETVAARIDSIFRANPGRSWISVSQNDSDRTYCRCEACERVNIEEGAPSGNYIRFLNKLAERFPDKRFSTLAYLFTMQPPRHARPLSNVNIMLCSIGSHREAPLTETATGREFVTALEGWSALTDNLFIWDYGINFDNMVEPFPNFPVLAPNIRLFRHHGARMHFSQIGGSYGGDFSELRSYVVAKLMWDPAQDADSLMQRFMNGYYGAAAPCLYQYEKQLEEALFGSGIPLWIYDSPVTHKQGMFSAACRQRYNELFDRAEAAVAADSALLRRVRLARLPLLYSELEILRTERDRDTAAVLRKLGTFERYVTDFGVETLNERNNSPQEYCKLYRQRYLSADRSKAFGARIEWIVPPAGKYRALGEETLTDGLFGGASFADGWTGWEGQDGAFILDLGSGQEFSAVTADFLHQLGAWILLPRAMTCAVSDDKRAWRPLGRTELAEDRDVPVKFVPVTVAADGPVRARYIRIEVEGTNVCPPWHYGVGCPCWFFIDEITVK
ncbi:DUF4838 domain-containing protein [uncultured Alistipes sp.]|uniref:DUF4838 domain-containing protein n=1 Tax=uncultured Alistipes sp. TaxID=538949 RepID=UPI002599A4CB|nr:DUF4838 domain-containing protein [uncultured Alistipes sp.]